MRRKLINFSLVASIVLFTGCGSDGAGTGGTGGGGTCSGNYTTADLRGCYMPDADAAVLNYYCFDGAGGYRNDMWNAMTGCSTQHTGQYEVNGCKLRICDETGCSDYNAQPYDGGLIIDGDRYSESNGCG